jgi:hypothetical protein
MRVSVSPDGVFCCDSQATSLGIDDRRVTMRKGGYGKVDILRADKAFIFVKDALQRVRLEERGK